MAKRFHTAGVAGLGLIGGSMAYAMKAGTDLSVAGDDRDPETLRMAAERCAIDRFGAPFTDCDLFFVALYPKDTVEYVAAHLPEFQRGTLIVDLCGVKRYVRDQLSELCRKAGHYYLGAHPMAGKEVSGFQNASKTLFHGASLILTPEPDFDETILTAFTKLMVEIGFGEIVRTTPEHHDQMIAYTSQLAHILSSAYIQNPLADGHGGFTGGSFQDLTRVSRLNGSLWGELFELNRDDLCEQINVLMDNLAAYRDALQNGDRDALTRLMANGTAIKERLLRERARHALPLETERWGLENL